MRRIELGSGEIFEEKMLNRTGAFNAEALIAATNIVEEVRNRGDVALREYTAKFDGVELETFRVPQSAIDEALTRVDPTVAAAIKQAAEQIRDFHERQKQQGWFTLREDGALVGAKVQPLDSVGIYVPGGRALYPSSVLMNAIPASVAGVRRIVCVTPPTKDGSLDPAILEACRVSGVTEIYSVGGAQAIAALAYGTESIQKVDKITGPGNAFVAAAKKVVSGDVGIDMIAGPSEVCVVAEITSGEQQITAGEKELQAGQTELDTQRQEYEKTKADALQQIADARAEVDDIEAAQWYIQTRDSNAGYTSVESDASSIEAIGLVFPVVFIIVAVLIALTTITRMVEEERSLIGTYKSLGYSRHTILMKYLMYALGASLIGGILGGVCGFIVFPTFLFSVVFEAMYQIPE